jgi:hypothetical protein
MHKRINCSMRPCLVAAATVLSLQLHCCNCTAPHLVAMRGVQVWSYGFTTSPSGQPELDSQLVGSSSTNGPGGGWQQLAGQQVLVPGVSAAERE